MERYMSLSTSIGQSISTRAGIWTRLSAQDRPFIADARYRIYAISFSLLFFELLCIRWIPSYVRYLSYFNNFILLASFLGSGLGILSARRARFWFPPFAAMLLLLTAAVAFNRFDLPIATTDVLYFGDAEAQ